MFKYEEAFIEERYKEIKKVGYTLEFTKLEDRLKVKFTSNMDLCPSYIEYLDNRIICYGDYSSFIFERIKIYKNPNNVNPIPSFLRKVDSNIKITMWSAKKAKDEISEFFYDLLKENEYTLEEIEEIRNRKIEILTYLDEWSAKELLEEFLQDYELGWYEEYFDETLGIVYSYQALEQLVIMRLIKEEYKKKESENEKISSNL